MAQLIRGKVARVLNTREIAINIGTTHGTTVGMYFDVMDANGEDIRDPDTNEVLGPIERPKVRVQVIHAQEKLSVATTSQTKGVNTSDLVDLATLAAIPTLGPVARSLIVTPRKPYAPLEKTVATADVTNENDNCVEIGDPVVQFIEKTE